MLSAAVTALRMLAELGVVLVLLAIDRGRSEASVFLRRRTDFLWVTCRFGWDDKAGDDGAWWSWSIVNEDRDRLKAEKTLKAVGGWT